MDGKLPDQCHPRATPLICTPCGDQIAGRAYLAVFRDEAGRGIRMEVGCEHQPVPNVDEALAVFGSGGCLAYWIEQQLTPREHDEEGEPS